MTRLCDKCGGSLDNHAYNFAMNCLTCGALYYYDKPDYERTSLNRPNSLPTLTTKMSASIKFILQSYNRPMTPHELVDEIIKRYPGQKASLRYIRQTLSGGEQFERAYYGYWQLNPSARSDFEFG